jgi:serine/threonine-protein kinase
VANTSNIEAATAAAFERTPYRIHAELGRGGMGVVLAAEHKELAKPVVIKLLHATLADRHDLEDRLRVEAQTLARLNHPNLVQVLDVGRTVEGRLFVVMERLYGRTLRQELRATSAGAIAVPLAIDWVRQALAGLSAAHSAGVIHRDIKLDNLFVCDAPAGGQRLVKVLDFGIAKITTEAEVAKPLVPTALGVLMGTPGYLSPEQAMGKSIDKRSDIYGIGVVLYCLLTGKGPHSHHGDQMAILRAQVMGPPPAAPSTRQQGVPAWLDHVVLRAMEREREARYPTALDLSNALLGPGSAARLGSGWQVTERVEALSDADDRGAGAAPPNGAAGRANAANTANAANDTMNTTLEVTAADPKPARARSSALGQATRLPPLWRPGDGLSWLGFIALVLASMAVFLGASAVFLALGAR